LVTDVDGFLTQIIAEMVVYGDNKSEILFDFFCEKNMLSLFLEIMWTEDGCPAAVHIQILQTLSILISCVKNNTSLYYLLSNNYVNEIINYPHNFDLDESLRDQFASFMKTLSLRLNKQTVQFFFIEETGGFPILTRAIELLYLNDNMVRIASQTTILNIYRVQDFRSRAYALQDEVLLTLFSAISALMLAQYKSLLQVCEQYSAVSAGVQAAGVDADIKSEEDSAVRSRLTSLENQLSDILVQSEDWLYYIMDMFDLGIMSLRRSLVVHLLNSFILPVLLPNVAKSAPYQVTLDGNVFKNGGYSDAATALPAKHEGEYNESTDLLSISPHVDEVVQQWNHIALIVSVAYLGQLLRVVQDSMLRRAILTALFHPCSRGCREGLIQCLANNGRGEALPSDIRNDDSASVVETDAVKFSSGLDAGGLLHEDNQYRVGFISFFEDSVEKSMLGCNLVRIIAEVFFGIAKMEALEDMAKTEMEHVTIQEENRDIEVSPTRAVQSPSVSNDGHEHSQSCGGEISPTGQSPGSSERSPQEKTYEVCNIVKSLTALSVWPWDLSGTRRQDATLSFAEQSAISTTQPLPRCRKSWNSSSRHSGRRNRDHADPEPEGDMDSDADIGEADDLDLPRLTHIQDPDIMHIEVLCAVQALALKSASHSALIQNSNGGHDESSPAVRGSPKLAVVKAPTSRSLLQVLADVMSSPEYPLCALQEAVHAVYGFASLAYFASHRDSAMKEAQLRYCVSLTRSCARQLSKRLLSRMSTPMGDLLLNLLQEELHRIRDRKWSSVSGQVNCSLGS
jgi:hypothetical protein